VVVATGFDRVPHTPAWPGRENFAKRLVHAADFGNLAQYRGKNILVVGAGNSGSDILNHLVTIPTGKLWVSVRHGPVVFPQRLWGFPVQRLSPLMALLPVRAVDRMLALTELVAFGRLEKWGWRRHPAGGATRLVDAGISPAIDRGFVAALKAGKLSLLPEIERFEPATVCLADGQRIEPDVVIAATGYRSGLESMLGHLDLLNDRGIAEIHGNQQDARYPGLWFTGMQPRLTGFFHLAGQTARAIASAIAEDYRDRETGLIAAGTELGEIRT
jgi:cation diffusion facilitator CzcD-associated flavoprotein CzcO